MGISSNTFIVSHYTTTTAFRNKYPTQNTAPSKLSWLCIMCLHLHTINIPSKYWNEASINSNYDSNSVHLDNINIIFSYWIKFNPKYFVPCLVLLRQIPTAWCYWLLLLRKEEYIEKYFFKLRFLFIWKVLSDDCSNFSLDFKP